MSNDLTIHKLWMQNFMSYGNKMTTIQLDSFGMTLIKGVNLDDTVNGIGANGVGKSSIINALVYAFYGESMGDSKIDELINDINKKKCIVGIEFSIGKDRYVIERFRKMKAGSEGTYTNIFMNDDIDKDSSDKSRRNLAKATLPETNKYTIDLIGMPKDLFIRLVVFDADEQSFFKMQAAPQREVMENLFHLTILSEKADYFREDQKNTKKEIEIQTNSIEFLEQKVEEYSDQITTAKQRITRWEKNRKSDLEDYEEDLKALQGIDIEYEKSLFDNIDKVEKEINELNTKVAAIKLEAKDSKSKSTENVNEADKHQTTIDSNNSKTKRLQKNIDKLKSEIATLQENKCPECLQQLPDAEEKIGERNIEITKSNKSMSTIEEDNLELKEKVDTCTHEAEKHQDTHKSILSGVSELLAQIEELNDGIEKPSVKSRDRLTKIESQRTVTEGKLANLQDSENPHIEAFNELDEKEIDDVDYTEINELKKLLDHQKFMLKLLTDKKSFLRQRLVNKRLPLLNERLTYYLTQLGLPYQVEFQSDLTAKIRKRGKTKSFGNLSHGQRARVNFALSFAFRDVMERINRRVNVCMLDEVLDKALCDVGANAAITMISDKCKADKISVFVITHKKEIANRFNNIMTVTMEKGFSYIK